MEKGDSLTVKKAKDIYSFIFGDQAEEISGELRTDRRADIRRYITTLKGKYQPKEGEASKTGELFYLVGSSLLEEGKPRFAVGALEKSLVSEERGGIEDREIHDRLSAAYQEIGDYTLALNHLNKSKIQGGQTDKGFKLRKAEILNGMGRTVDAYKLYQEIVAEDPKDIEAYDGMLAIEASNKNLGGFLEVMNEMADANRGNKAAKRMAGLRAEQFMGRKLTPMHLIKGEVSK